MTALEVATTAATYALADLDEMQNYVTEDLQRFATAALEAAMPHVEVRVITNFVDGMRKDVADETGIGWAAVKNYIEGLHVELSKGSASTPAEAAEASSGARPGEVTGEAVQPPEPVGPEVHVSEEAVDAGIQALLELDNPSNVYIEQIPNYRRQMRASLAAALPHFEAAIRQEVADDIRAVAESYPSIHLRPVFRELARIVGEGHSK